MMVPGGNSKIATSLLFITLSCKLTQSGIVLNVIIRAKEQDTKNYDHDEHSPQGLEHEPLLPLQLGVSQFISNMYRFLTGHMRHFPRVVSWHGEAHINSALSSPSVILKLEFLIKT